MFDKLTKTTVQKNQGKYHFFPLVFEPGPHRSKVFVPHSKFLHAFQPQLTPSCMIISITNQKFCRFFGNNSTMLLNENYRCIYHNARLGILPTFEHDNSCMLLSCAYSLYCQIQTTNFCMFQTTLAATKFTPFPSFHHH